MPTDALQPYIDPQTWLAWGVTAGRIVLIFGMTWLALTVIRRLTQRWERRDERNPGQRSQRATIASLVRSAARYVLWPMALFMVLSEVGLDIGPLLAGAGIAGLAIGFGAQTLVKDVISGIFLLFDDTVHVGDLITFDGKVGTVEHVGLRLIKFRTFEGEVVIVPSGEMRVFGNKSIDYARAIVDVGLSYEQDTDAVLVVLGRLTREWAAEPTYAAMLLDEPPQVQALVELADSAVTVRVVVKVRPGDQFAVERELRRRIKRTFDAEGIEIPFPRQTLYLRQETVLPARAPARPADGPHESRDDLFEETTEGGDAS